MRDVIQKIVATENEAKRTIEEARAQADRIIFEARMQAQDITARALQDASGEASRIVEEATAAAENKQQEILNNAVARIDSQVHIDDTVRKQIIDDIVKLVCGRHP
ncbi:MAG: V-type ATPase subunit subunit G family protein [Syntrophorhabdus sp.]